jgi:hypothetical protein
MGRKLSHTDPFDDLFDAEEELDRGERQFSATFHLRDSQRSVC